MPDPRYFKRIREICDKHGILIIVDEVEFRISREGKDYKIEINVLNIS